MGEILNEREDEYVEENTNKEGRTCRDADRSD